MKDDEQIRKAGRPRDEHARQAVLAATLALLAEDPAAASVEAIARRAGVSRPLIYRWWPDRSAVALDALLEATATAAPYPDTGSPLQDLRHQMREYVNVLNGPLGGAYRALFADAQHNPATAENLRARLITPRRMETRSVLQQAIRSGALRPEIDLDAVIDQLYAPLLYRLLLGHAPLDHAVIDVLVDQLLTGVRTRS